MKKFFLLFFILLCVSAISQDTIKKVPWDDKYREDQFFLSINHDLFLNNPKDEQNALSIGLSTGFLRDIAVSKNRKFAIAPGIAFSYKRHNTFILPSELSLDDNSANINQFLIELPIELRWRNSTVENTQFFRIHLGSKLSYRIFGDITFIDNDKLVETLQNKMTFINAFNFQNYLAFGYSIFNVFVAYTYTPFYKNSTFNQSKLNVYPLSLGFIFYIL